LLCIAGLMSVVLGLSIRTLSDAGWICPAGDGLYAVLVYVLVAILIPWKSKTLLAAVTICCDRAVPTSPADAFAVAVTALRRTSLRLVAAEDQSTILRLLAERRADLGVPGVGTVLAAKLLGHIGDITRFPSASNFASYTGTAPLDASSGQQNRHRLNT
jgi:hypothetical protein